MNRLCTSIITYAVALTASAQIHLTAELNNNHLWRGIEVADGCVVTTNLNYTLAHGHMTLGLWGGTNTQGTYKEFNHYLSVQGAGLHLQLFSRCLIQQPPIFQLCRSRNRPLSQLHP